MKQCQMILCPTPECDQQCLNEGTEVVELGEHMSMRLCKEHYDALNKAFKGCCSDINNEETPIRLN